MNTRSLLYVAAIVLGACGSSGGSDAGVIDAGTIDAGGMDSAVGADAQKCSADCECVTFNCCEQGVCRQDNCAGRPAMGLCEPGGACPCVGGTCDERFCCVLPDGGIDDGFGPACMPP